MHTGEMPMSADPTVSDLIRRVRAGEQGAREQLFDRYDAYLHVLARAQLGRHLRGKCDSADVVQETLLEAHRDFAAFQGNTEPELLAWLRRILSHNLFNEARRFAAQQRDTSREISIDQVRAGVEHSSVALARGLAADTPTPSQVASQRESAVRLADALAKLPDDYRDVLVLRVFEELPAEEVAQRMNRTAGAVRMLQMRALQALREVMGAETA
jgi:RNA polymerase sigma-70 factor, ECF subfamily